MDLQAEIKTTIKEVESQLGLMVLIIQGHRFKKRFLNRERERKFVTKLQEHCCVYSRFHGKR